MAETHGATTAWVPVARAAARTASERIVERWRRGLRRDHQSDPELAYAEAMQVLVTMGLVRETEEQLLVHAAAARYAPVAELVTTPGPVGERSLFDEEDDQ